MLYETYRGKNLKHNNLKFSKNLNRSFKNTTNFNVGEKSAFDDGKSETFRETLDEFLKNTSLHGLKYAGNYEISLIERVFFIFAFAIVFLLSLYFITNVYTKWSATPIIIGISPTPTLISSIPFPAVTICNLNQARRSKVKHIDEGTLEFSLLESLCARDVQFASNVSAHSGRWMYFRQFLLNVSQPCNELLLLCKFGSNKADCSQIFRPILTDEGLCCIFNDVDPKFMFYQYSELDNFDAQRVRTKAKAVNWTPETGYSHNLPKDFYPRKALGTGSHMGLTVILNSSANEYYCSSMSSVGFKILLHNPIETPKISNYGTLISTGTENRIRITPSFADASPALRTIKKRFRQCLFGSEGNLTFYRTYSKKNCELECESRLLQQECGCVLYYLPRTSAETVICGFKDQECTKEVRLSIEKSSNSNLSCDGCWPGCYELSYSIQASSSKFSKNRFLAKEKFIQKMPSNLLMENIAAVHIYYGSNSYRSETKEELIGFTEFLSNTGGLLGLFMGFSVLSLIEIIYFITLRPYCAVKRKSSPAIKPHRHAISGMTGIKGRRTRLSIRGFFVNLKEMMITVKNKITNFFKPNQKDDFFPYYE